VAVAYWVDYGLSFVQNGAQWRFPIALQVIFAMSTAVLISFLPESPRWFLSHDRVEEAIEVLKRIHSDDGMGVVEKERLEIATALSQERLALGGKHPLQMVFTNGKQRVFYRTMLGVIIMSMQQLTGINLIT
jgi:hypothetical protein